MTVRGVSPDADGNVIPWGSRKDASGIGGKITRDSQSALSIEMQRVEKKLMCLPIE